MKNTMTKESMENSDLLTENKNIYINNEGAKTLSARNGNVPNGEVKVPPDGGVWAYSVMMGSFLTNGLLFGVINSYSVIYRILQKQLQEDGAHNSESRAALVGSLAMGTTFLCSPIAGMMTRYLGLRVTAILGGTIAAAGLLLSSFLVEYVDALCFTYGIMYGLGASFAYTPSLAVLGHYFKKRLGLVNGIVTIGSSVFTVIMPPLMTHTIDSFGLSGMFRVLAALTFGVALSGLLFKQSAMVSTEKEDKNLKALLKTLFNVHNFKNISYRFWALSLPIGLCGYFVPYVHIGKLIDMNFSGSNVNLPLQCIAFTSGIGRLSFGFLADKPGIDRILLQQISFYVIGTLTIILPFVTSYPLLVVISLGMGLCDGAFIALIGPIAFELCGRENAAQAIGCVLGIAALPLSIGPTVAGYLVGLYKSYTLPFVLSGISPLVGATLMFSIRFNRKRSLKKPENLSNGHAEALRGEDAERSPGLLINSEAK